MNFHIYHSWSLLHARHDWDVDDDFVKKIVKEYLSGEQFVKINGNNLLIGTKELLIYENPKDPSLGSSIVDSMNKVQGSKTLYSRDFFERTFKNVTDRFLQGMVWGDLKENYYNIYINDGTSKPVLLVLDKQEVAHVLLEWERGSSIIWVAGRRIDLENPKSIKIFAIDFEWLSKERGAIKVNLKNRVNHVYEGKWSPEALELFGKEVTENWDVKSYGLSKKLDFSQQSIEDELSAILKNGSGNSLQINFPVDIIEKGKKMSEAYQYIYFVENYLRYFIQHIQGLQLLKLPTDIQKTITRNKAYEAQNKFLPLRGDSDLFYCDFVQLQQIITNNWEVFKTHVPQQDQHWLRVKIEDMYRVRNLIAHCGFITQDDLQMVKTNFRMIVSQLKV